MISFRHENGRPDRLSVVLVPVNAELAKEIVSHIETFKLTRSQPVFGFTEEERRQFERAHRRASKKIGQMALRLKDLRHLAAISWARAGVRLKRIGDWLGHSDIRQTTIYARFAPDDEFDAPLIASAAKSTNSIIQEIPTS